MLNKTVLYHYECVGHEMVEVLLMYFFLSITFIVGLTVYFTFKSFLWLTTALSRAHTDREWLATLVRAVAHRHLEDVAEKEATALSGDNAKPLLVDLAGNKHLPVDLAGDNAKPLPVDLAGNKPLSVDLAGDNTKAGAMAVNAQSGDPIIKPKSM
jgi:hypothetical protein